MQGWHVDDELVQGMSGKDFSAHFLEQIGGKKLLEHSHYITCPTCGTKVPIAKMNRLGRKPLNISVNNIYDTLQACHNIALAAEKLGCSRGYIYKVLKEQGRSPRDFIRVD